ncbi:MAG: signal peptidase I [Anaerolineales bacterium]|nr:signal peptidase I [Anaerolineales bacterium]
MSIYHRRSLALLTALWFALMAAIWISLAPIQAGGLAAYVVIAGQSMEPNLHFGDLVIVHKSSDYQVGDVVAYQNADIDRYVIHRIIAKKNGRFVLQGDNNAWIDKYEPTRQEVLGKLWVHLPNFGTYMQKLREPIYMAIFAGLIGSMAAATLFVSKRREKQPMKENSRKTELNIRKGLATLGQHARFGKLMERFSRNRTQNTDILSIGRDSGQNGGQGRNSMETLFFALAVVAFLSLLLGILSFTRPATQMISDEIGYQHLGFFSYSAAAPAGVYDTTTIRSGEPIFPSLTCSIEIAFNYSLAAVAPENIGGSYQLTAVLAHPQSGWQRTIPLQEQTPFSGNAFNTQARLNLCEVVKLVESVEEITSARPGVYILSIDPRVHVAGLIAGRALDSTFEPNLTFQYDRTQFYLAGPNEDANLLNPSEANSLREEKRIQNTVSFFGAELNVPILRTIAVIGLVLSLSGLAVLWLQLDNIARTDQETFVRLKYDPLIIDVEENSLRTSTQSIDVNSIDDLAKLAEKHNMLILHETQDSVDHYFVHLDGISYVYSQGKRQPKITPGFAEDFHVDIQRGLELGEFQVYYQPIVSLTNGQITSVEALLRWQHPQRGMIPAGEFIQKAETTGDIGKLDEWVMQVACKQLRGWQDAGFNLKLAVNLSTYTLDREPAELVQRILQMTGTDPNWLQIEIPEAKMTGHAPKALLQLKKLEELGIHITIDDFVGDLGLLSISQLPINSIKMNHLLVQQMSDSTELNGVQRMIAVATALGLNVVGKGVETNEERDFLAKAGSSGQGFLLGRPAPAQEIGELFRLSMTPANPKPKKRLINAKDKT